MITLITIILDATISGFNPKELYSGTLLLDIAIIITIGVTMVSIQELKHKGK